MQKLSLMLMILCAVAFAGTIETLTKMGFTDIKKANQVPEAIQGPLVSIAAKADGDTFIINSNGERLGTLKADEIDFEEHVEPITSVYFATDASGILSTSKKRPAKKIVVLWTPDFVILICDKVQEIQGTLNYRFLYHVNVLKSNKGVTFLVK